METVPQISRSRAETKSQTSLPRAQNPEFRACFHYKRLTVHINTSATIQHNTLAFGRKFIYFFMYQNLRCADGEEAYSSKMIFPWLRRKPGSEQSLKQNLGQIPVNPAVSELVLIPLSSSAFKSTCESFSRLS